VVIANALQLEATRPEQRPPFPVLITTPC